MKALFFSSFFILLKEITWVNWEIGKITNFTNFIYKSAQSSGDYFGLDFFEDASITGLIRRGQISIKQKEIANNYAVIKKIFGFSAVNSRISNSEIGLLSHHGMSTLEETTARQMYTELEMLRQWTNSTDEVLQKHSDSVFEIRVKELKFLQANNSIPSLGELYDGYSTLEKYVEYIAG